MKKFLALMLAMLMALSLVACGGGNNAADDNNANNGDDAAMTKLVLGRPDALCRLSPAVHTPQHLKMPVRTVH